MKRILETAGIFLAVAAIVFGYFMTTALAYSDFIIPNYAVTALYQFDDNLTNNVGPSATIGCGSGETYTTGKFNDAFSFDGSKCVTVASTTIAGSGSGWTVGLWYKTSATNKFYFGENDGANAAGIYDDTGTLKFHLCNGGGCTEAAATSTSADGNWHLAIATYDGTTLTLYADNSKHTATKTFNTIPANGVAGANYDGSQKLVGSLDNLFILNYQMGDAEAETIWSNGGERVALEAGTVTTENDSIGFNTPTQAQSLRNDDPNIFNVSWFTGATTTNEGWTTIQVKYGTSTGGFASTTFTASTTRTWSLQTWNQADGNGFSAFSVPKTADIIPNQRYYAEADLIWETLSGPNLTTLVSTTTASTTVLFFGTATTTPTADACNGVWDCILYGFAQTLFTPHDISMSSFRATYNQLQTSPPFSYLFGYVAAASNAATSSIATTTDYDVVLHFPSPWNDITVLTSSSYSNFVGTSTTFTKEKFFDIQRMVIWIGAGLKLISIFII